MYQIITKTTIDNVNGTPVIISSVSEIHQISIPPITFTHKLNVSERRYGIFTFGAKASISQFLQPGATLKVRCDGEDFIGNVHLTTRGRVDGLTSLIIGKSESTSKRFWVGNTINCEYDSDTGVLTVL